MLESALIMGFPQSLQCGRPGFESGFGKIPWRKARLPTPVFRPGKFHGLYSPWGRKELEKTERLSLSFFRMLESALIMCKFRGQLDLARLLHRI